MKFEVLDRRMRIYETAHDHCVLSGIHMGGTHRRPLVLSTLARRLWTRRRGTLSDGPC